MFIEEYDPGLIKIKLLLVFLLREGILFKILLHAFYTEIAFSSVLKLIPLFTQIKK